MKARIAFISEHASPLATLGGVDSGGQNVYVGELACQLALAGYEVDIFTRCDNNRLPIVVQWAAGVRIIHIEAGPKVFIEKEQLLPYMNEFTSRAARYFQDGSYDLIHANFFMSALVAADIKQMFHVPFVVTFHALGAIRTLHQGDKDRFPPERISIEKRVVKECDFIIAECPQDKEDLINHYEADHQKISVIPCGFNPNEFYPIDKLLAKMVLKIDTNDPIILQLGRMVTRKGVANVINALARLKRTNTPVHLIIVGGEADQVEDDNSPEVLKLRELAKKEGLERMITFAGRKNRDVLKYYYSAADIFVTTPWYEPFGITPLESMACGTPVIGSNVGGIKYSVEHGKTGFLVAPENPDELASRIFELLNNPEQLAEMRQHALKRVNFFFTWSKVAQQIDTLYERVLEKNNPLHEREALSIDRAFDSAIHTLQKSKRLLSAAIQDAAALVVKCFHSGHKVLICGNGGSASESQHFSAELVGRFEMASRKALPALALTSDTSIITAWANDVGYEHIFSRQVEAYGEEGDVLFCFSTSGQSLNLVNAMKAALEKGMKCIALTGKTGGELTSYASLGMVVPSMNTQRIQELHLFVLHTLCSLIENRLFGNKQVSKKMNGVSSNGNIIDRL